MSATGSPGSARPAPGRALGRLLREASPFDWALRLLLLALLLDTSLSWVERVPVTLLAGSGLLLPGLVRSRVLWAALTAVTCVSLLLNWPFSDNHDYLTTLACLAAVCALVTRRPADSLATSARLLIGLVFAFAVLWKLVLAPDFLDGRFFRVTLLTDRRFQDLAVVAGDMTWTRWDENDERLRDVLAGRRAWSEEGFDEPAALRRLAWLATGYTAVVELWVALAFLWPPGGRLGRTRDVPLLLFAITTYPFATVRGFGWLLMALGVAQSRRPGARLVYTGSFFLIEIYRSVPWSEALVRALGRTGT